MIITGIVASIGGPILWGFIFDARESEVNTRIVQAADVVRNRLTFNPELATNKETLTDEDKAALRGALAEEFGSVNWIIEEWIDRDTSSSPVYDASTGIGQASDVFLQFIKRNDDHRQPGRNNRHFSSPWIVGNNTAVRLGIVNKDGAWACALIVLKPKIVDSDITLNNFVFANSSTTTLPPGVTESDEGAAVVAASMGGVWYDSGDIPDNNVTERMYRCAFMAGKDSTPRGALASLPGSPTEWRIGNPTTTDVASGGKPITALKPNTAWTTLKKKP